MYASTDASSSGLGNPLLLRKVPSERLHIAEKVAGPIAAAGCTWWELTDAAADLNQRPAAVAVTRVGANQVVHIDLLATDAISERDPTCPPAQRTARRAAAERRNLGVHVSSR